MYHVVSAILLIFSIIEPDVVVGPYLFVFALDASELQFDVCVDGDVDHDDGKEDDVARCPTESDSVPVRSHAQVTVSAL